MEFSRSYKKYTVLGAISPNSLIWRYVLLLIIWQEPRNVKFNTNFNQLNSHWIFYQCLDDDLSGSFVHLVEVTIRVGTRLGVMSATLSEPLNTQLFSPINKPKFSRNISELCVQNLNIFIESLKLFYCYAKYLNSGNAGPTLYSSILYLTILGDKIYLVYFGSV